MLQSIRLRISSEINRRKKSVDGFEGMGAKTEFGIGEKSKEK
jgi:hypothetical protein